MRRTPFQPSLFIQISHKSSLLKLILERLPKRARDLIFDSASWNSDASLIAFNNAKMRLVVISPAGFDYNVVKNAIKLARESSTPIMVLLSTHQEFGHWFTQSDLTFIENSFKREPNCLVFKELNKLMKHVRNELDKSYGPMKGSAKISMSNKLVGEFVEK
jgi:hypothetical protein